MKPSVYIETSVIGYLAMRPSNHLVTAGNQCATHDFWIDHRTRFELFVSLEVLRECSAGDAAAANERKVFLEGIPVLDINESVALLAETLLRKVPLPPKANIDALHIAVAAVNGLDYLVTWNCRHIANPALRGIIEDVCESTGYGAPVICTPPELIEVQTNG